jgi:hypothetical protein
VEGVIARSVALGRIVCITAPEQAAERDRQFLQGEPPPLPAFPKLSTGLLHRVGTTVVAPAGELCIQAQVAVGDETGRFDDLIGRGWLVLTLEFEPSLSRAQQEFLLTIGARCVSIVSNPTSGEIFDVDGDYRKFFSALCVSALVVRPDFYLFGACLPEYLPTLIDDLMAQVTRVAA